MSELKVDKFTGVGTAGSILVTGEGNSTTTNLQQGLAKIWSYLNGTGTIAGRDSLNIASYTDNGTGDYTHTFTNSMNNDDYCNTATARRSSSLKLYNNATALPTSSAASQICTGVEDTYTGESAADSEWLHIAVFGDLA